MNEHILYVNQSFLTKFSNERVNEILLLNGINGQDDYFDKLLFKLNDQYNFLNITDVNVMPKEEENKFSMFNGYISGLFNEYYDTIHVSFTDFQSKNGNTYIYQQTTPMITSFLLENPNYLNDERILKILIQNSVITSTSDMSKNIVDSNSSCQLVTKIINTIGFDHITMIKIRNLNTTSKFNKLDELVDYIKYLNFKNPSNRIDDLIQIIDNKLQINLKFEMKGQEFKFFILRALAAINLSNIPVELIINDQLDKLPANIIALKNYIKYFNENKLFEEKVNFIQKKIEFIDNPETDTKNAIDVKGRKVFRSNPTKLMEDKVASDFDYKCACHDNEHRYFTSNSTKKNYLEMHHIIPFSNQEYYLENYKIDLDVKDNLIPLCPHCHRKIHLAVAVEKAELINKIFQENEEALLKLDPSITIFKLYELYNVFLIS